ncbi:MAG: alpha-L-fucosidase [Thermoguttaceae bacterium]
MPAPTSAQRKWQDMAFGMFFHWAPNVYQGGESDNLSTPREKINPDRFNADRWVDVAKAAHARYIIFVAKHVGGYCCWQTKTTDYSLTTSPWKAGKGDMVGELAKACAARGIRFGVYLSPADGMHGVGTGGNAGSAEKQERYNDLYRRQLSEILGHYGPIVEIWFDSGNVVPVNDLLDRLSPGVVTFQGRRGGGSRWIGNEEGFAPYPCWNTIAWKPGDVPMWGGGSPNGNLWCPAECDVSIIRPRWFWSRGCEGAILSRDALLEVYYLSIGRGANLLLNVTPDDHGEVPAVQMKRLTEFGAEIQARFAKPLQTTNGQGDNIAMDLRGLQTIDHVLLREDTRGGERVRRFSVEGRRSDGKWVTLVRGTQIGNRQFIPLSPVAVTAVRLMVKEAVAPVMIREFSVFHVARPAPPASTATGADRPST